jgi:hypothetical protein
VARLNAWFGEYPMLAGIAFGVLVVAVLVVVFGVLMHRSGLSLRPLVWFVVLLALVAGPQAVVHVLDVVAYQRQSATAPVDAMPAAVPPPSDVWPGDPARKADAPAAPPGPGPVPWDTVFGPDADPVLMVDPRTSLETVLGAAEEARLSFAASGASALAARFASPDAAAAAFERYIRIFQFASTTGNAAVGVTGQRYGGLSEWNHVVRAGNELYAWTGPDRADVIAKRERALGRLDGSAHTPAALADAAPATLQRAHETRLVSGNLGWQVMVPFAAVNLIAVVLWFFWGAAWAARTEPAPVAPGPADVLRGRLLAAYGGESPVTGAVQPDGSVVLDWNYADARWLDHMRAHRMKRTHRLVLHFDEAARTVRVRELWSAFDASAGAGSARLEWHADSGIQFFRLEQRRVFGAQLDAAGRPAGALGAGYTFDLQAMKQPAVDAVTAAGWRWQPALVNGPAWLRWLTG